MSVHLVSLCTAGLLAWAIDHWILARRRRCEASGATPPNPTVPATATIPAPVAEARDAPYRTRAEDVVAPAAWARVGDVLMASEPLRDRATGGYAHLSYRDALEAVARLGARLPTRAEVIALDDAARAAGLQLDPVILPDVAMLRAAGAPVDRRTTGIAEQQAKSADVQAMAQRLREAHMTGRAWAEAHDARVRAQLTARGWDGSKPVSNAGKLWIAGAPPGRAYLMGWREKDGSWIQAGATSGPGPHNNLHADYGTLVVPVRST